MRQSLPREWSAWRRERAKIQELSRIAEVVLNRAYNIRAIKSLATSAEVAFKVVVQLKRLATLKRHGAVQTPSIFQFLPISPHVRQIVSKNPREAVANVKIRVAIFQVRSGAVIRLSGVRLEIKAVTRVVKRVRPHVVDD